MQKLLIVIPFLIFTTTALADSYNVTGQTQYYGNTSQSQYQIHSYGTQPANPYNYTIKPYDAIGSMNMLQRGLQMKQERKLRELQIQLLQQQLNGQ